LKRKTEMAKFNSNEGISAASFYCQVAALVPDMFCSFYLAENHKIATNSATAKAREKNKHIFVILKILDFLKCMFD
jgi:hypothetical protein